MIVKIDIDSGRGVYVYLKDGEVVGRADSETNEEIALRLNDDVINYEDSELKTAKDKADIEHLEYLKTLTAP